MLDLSRPTQRWALILAPSLVVALVALHLAGRAEQARERAFLQALASAEARQIDLQLETYKAALLTIANSEALVEHGDLATLQREAERVGALFGGWFVLAEAGPQMNIVMNTSGSGRLPPPEPRGAYPEVVAAEQAALQSRRPEVSDAFPGRVVNQTVVTLAVPVETETDTAPAPGQFLYMSFDMHHLSRLLARGSLPAGTFAAIADGSRRVIASSADIAQYELAPLPPWYVAATAGQDSGVFVGAPIGQPDMRRTFALQRLTAAPQWTLVVSAPVVPAILAGLGTVWPALAALGTFLALFAATEAGARYRAAGEARRRAEAEVAATSALVDALRAAEARKAKLLGIVGHELRTPLVAQLGMLDLLEAGLRGAGPAGADGDAGLIERARREGHAMLALLDDLLEVARLGSGQPRLRDSVFDPAALLQDTAEILAPMAARNGNTVILRVEGEVGPVRGDPAALRRILLNFGTNAAKFTTGGTLTLGLAAHPDGPGRMRLDWWVTDTGAGIAPEDMGRLFEEFGMLEATRALAPGGTGLGLAICKGLAQAMGGQVSAESVPGQGSTFRFSVSLPAEAAARPDTRPAPEADLTGARILVAEDQEIIRLVAARQLEAAGATVDTAADGAAAVACAEAATYDVILMDLRMPGLDGAVAAQRIRAGGGPNAATPIIGLTAHQTPETAVLLSRGAITACLSKPLDIAALARFRPGAAGQEGGPGRGDAGASGPAMAPAPALIDRATLDDLAAVHPDIARRLVASLLQETEATVPRIAAALASRDLPGLAERAHRLSGLAKIGGAAALARCLDRIEAAARAGDARGAGRAAADLAELARQTAAALRVRLAPGTA